LKILNSRAAEVVRIQRPRGLLGGLGGRRALRFFGSPTSHLSGARPRFGTTLERQRS